MDKSESVYPAETFWQVSQHEYVSELFEIGRDQTLFDDYTFQGIMHYVRPIKGKVSVVSLSLKGINGTTYEEARRFLVKTINEEARRLSLL